MTKSMNEKPIEHISANGTTFKCSRADLKSIVRVSTQWEISPNKMLADFAEFGAWHSMNIWNQLNGFQGYDTVKYKIKK